MRKSILLMLAILCMTSAMVSAQDKLTITTWNIEHLGSPGRGFGGGFGGSGSGSIPPRNGELPKRSDDDLKKIAEFIEDELKSDLIALQEIAITGRSRGRSKSAQLDKVVSELEQDGDDWSYFLPHVLEKPADNAGNEFLAFLWNRKRARLLTVFEMPLENQDLAGKSLFDRTPLVGYFEALNNDGNSRNDFVLVNVHLASGQDHDENHLIAMTLIEFELNAALANHAVTESDIIILGDFNDNPSLKKSNGDPQFSNALYEHMEFKGYIDLATADLKTTRMNSKLNSLIDHILVNSSARADVSQQKANIFKPGGGDGNSDLFAEWRLTFSDHFPLSFEMRVRADNDADFFR